MKTTIPIKIQTGYINENPLTEARQRIEKAGIYIESLFNFIKLSKNTCFNGGIQDNGSSEILEDIENVCEIGTAIALSILDSAEIVSGLEKSENSDNLTAQLSAVLNNPNLPERVFDALMRGITDLQGDRTSDLLNKFESSPEYLSSLFLDVLTSKEEENEVKDA